MESMEESENKLKYQNYIVLKKHMPSRKDATETQDESKYVDLVTDGMKTVNVYVTGEGSQMAIHEGKEDLTADEKSRGDTVLARKVTDHIKRDKEYFIAKECPKGYLSGFLGTICFSEVPILNENIMDCTESQVVVNGEVQAERTRDVSPLKIEEAENPPVEEQDDTDLQYTDMLSEQSESDDDVSLVPGDCDDGVAFNAEDESHYITTHEIQLSEFSDHDVDYDIDQGWDDNHVYSFIDYAAFDSDVTMPGKEERLKSNQGQANSGAAVSTTLEVDLRDGDKCAISDESLSKNQKNVGGPIHLSIKTTSQAINEPSNFYENEHILYHAKHAADMSRYIFRADANGEKLCDSAKCFIAAPGRLHISSKLKGKDLNEYSSGTSSAVSELDDADKEVRNLTARAFKSLAYPYFDPFNFSTSSESSASELGVNRWSTFVDLKYGNLNMSKAREPNRVSNKSSTSSSEFTNPKEKMGHKGLTLTTKPPSNKLFALKGALSGPYNASSAAKKFELMGKFGQRHSGVITLTETLNFRCNVTSGLPGSDRRSKFAQKSTGSRSIDTVTNTLPSGQESEASKQPCNPGETMEGTHKKAIFASSLLKNVISKKMQFEQERKMERGEIREPHTQPPCFIKQETEMTHRERDRATPKASKDFQRRSSKYSEANSDLTIVCVDELGDLVDTSSSDAKFDGRRQDLASGTHLVATHEVGFDAKKEAIDAPKSTLLRSQNSAFRSWRDGELMFQTELKNEKTLKEKPSSSPQSQEKMDLYTDSRNGKLTKMSHLFVPSIQLLSNDDVSKKVPTVNNSTRAHADKRGMALCTNNTLYVADPRNVVAPKSPEIKISLRSIKENKGDQFNVSKLVPPNIASNSVNLLKPGEESRCQALAAALKAESSDKIPHFTVRDIRDHKGKLQTPIHQVRDVRKLVKSSYHFVSLENNATAGDPQSDQKLSKQGTYRKPASLSPIIIKCQSVNTNGNGKQSGNLIENSKRTPNEDSFDVDRSLPQQEGDKNDLQQPKGTVPSDNSKQVKGDSSEEPIGLPIETITVTKKREKTPDMAEKIKPESNISNMAALEKLQAAVKTMEQLYVFDRNEWKRKSEPHSELSDSHVLPLISSEEYGPEVPMATMTTPIKDKLTQENCFKHSDKALHETMPTKHQKEPPNTYYIPISRDVSKPFTLQAGTPEVTKNVIKVSSKASGNSKSNGQKVSLQPPASTQSAYCKGFSSVSPKLTVSGKITQPLRNAEERESGRVGERPVQFSRALAEPQNYLTIPVKTQVASAKQGVTSSGEGREKTAVYTFTGTRSQNRNASPPGLAGARMQDETGQSPQKRATVIMETRAQDTPSSTIFHHVPMGLAPAQPQVYCFSPGIAPHAMPQVDHFQHTQRKMLFDPTTGNYYLVDTPIQPVTRRLFDPETGQYVDVPISQQPMSPLPISMPTMPMPMSPLAMSSGSYGPTYMIYPGFMPTVPATPTLIPARMPSQPSMQSEQEDSGDKGRSSQPDYMESPYYLATGSGKSPQAGGSAMGQVNTRPGLQGFSNGKQPVISISSQQGPRIIAPASFDGTTMSFVLEHR